jgi:hypothetical protein
MCTAGPPGGGPPWAKMGVNANPDSASTLPATVIRNNVVMGKVSFWSLLDETRLPWRPRGHDVKNVWHRVRRASAGRRM